MSTERGSETKSCQTITTALQVYRVTVFYNRITQGFARHALHDDTTIPLTAANDVFYDTGTAHFSAETFSDDGGSTTQTSPEYRSCFVPGSLVRCIPS